MDTSTEGLKKRRQQLGATRYDVALEIGIRENSLYRWETGRGEPSPMARKAWTRAIELLEEEQANG